MAVSLHKTMCCHQIAPRESLGVMFFMMMTLMIDESEVRGEVRGSSRKFRRETGIDMRLSELERQGST